MVIQLPWKLLLKVRSDASLKAVHCTEVINAEGVVTLNFSLHKTMVSIL